MSIATIHLLYEDAIFPVYKTSKAAGMDLHAYLPDGPVTIPAHGSATFKTGVASEFSDDNHYFEIHSRSGLAFRLGVVAFPGVIDADYPPDNEWGVLLFNHSANPIAIKHGDRIAQAVLQEYKRPDNALIEGVVRTGGLGSTGVES